MLDVVAEVVGGILRAMIPDRQPWRTLALVFTVLAVAGAVVGLALAF